MAVSIMETFVMKTGDRIEKRLVCGPSARAGCEAAVADRSKHRRFYSSLQDMARKAIAERDAGRKAK